MKYILDLTDMLCELL